LAIQAKTNINPIIAITLYKGTCGSFTYYDCTNELEPGTGHLSMAIDDSSLAGEELFISVTRGNSNNEGDFELCIYQAERPVNENCNNAITLTNEKGYFDHSTFSNRYGKTSGQVGEACGDFEDADVWFKTIVPASGDLIVHAKSEDIEPVLVLYSGTCNDLKELTCSSSYSETEIIYNDEDLAGEEVFIRVYADGDDLGGTFDILVLEPSQDFCAEARPLDGENLTEEFLTYTNRYASNSVDGDAPTCGIYQGRDIWFRVDVPASGELVINSKGSEDLVVKPVLTLYKGDCDNLTEVACNEFGSGYNLGGKILLFEEEGLANETVYIRVHNYNSTIGGAFELSVHNPTAPLPVELLRFSANTIDSEIILDWATASEENNDYFIVEHSTDGRAFTPIEQVRGNGTTNDIQQYTYVDEDPFFGENYYRLKQVDFNGDFEYSGVVVANVSFTSDQFLLFPNPGYTKDVTTLRWTDEVDTKDLVILVTNTLGRMVYERGLEGRNAKEVQIDWSEIDMDAGIYFLQLRNEKQVLATRRFNLLVD
ncbi:MAG: T9SS type A sorting domain-containing protein, partial [Saprospiraceae bacterium]